MKHEKMRIAKITDEMVNYLYSIGAKDISIRLLEQDDQYNLTYKSDYEEINQDKLDNLITVCKNCGKTNEIEEFYWELLGDNDSASELALVRMMIDEIEIDIEDDYIKLILIRKKGSEK